MGSYPKPQGHALRRGRFSQPGATYFLTLCTEERHIGLTHPAIAERIFAESHAMTADTTWTLRAATVMPDHIHLLVTLGDRLPLDKSANRLKAKTSAFLKSHAPALIWQRGFFDHKLRADESLAAILHYIHLNHYRAGLCERTARWPWFHCRAEEWSWFKDSLDADLPPPEWLER
jgi:putative transposase